MRKRKHILLMLLILLLVVPVFASNESQISVSKKYDLQFSLSGGNIGGKFNLAGDFLYAQAFGELFVQAAGFANLGQTKEYGGSFGLGSFSDTGDLYLFIDSLYSYGKLWTQLRPTARLRFSWMSLTAFYALSLSKSTIQIDGQEIGAANYWGGELNLVPVSWARLYGNLMFISTIHTYKFGAEVRPIKWLSLSADWNKTDSGIYSKWNNQDLRVAINFLFGGQQQSLSPTYRVQIAPMYPVITRKAKPEVTGGEVEIRYRRVKPVIYPNAGGVGVPTTYHNVYGGQNASELIQTSENTWMATISLQCSPTSYWIWLYDTKVSKEPVGYEVSVRLKGDSQWFLLTRIVVNPFDAEGEAVQVIFDKGRFAN